MGRSPVMAEPEVNTDLIELTLRLRGIAAACSEQAIAAAAVQTARWALDTDVSWCGLIDRDSLVMIAHQGMRNPDIAELWRLPLGQGIGGRVATEGRPIVVRDYARDPRRVPVLKALIDTEELRSSICVPIRADELIIGVLYVSQRELRTFGPDEVGLASSIAELTGSVLASFKLGRAREESIRDARQHIEFQQHTIDGVHSVMAAGAAHSIPHLGLLGAVRSLAGLLAGSVELLDANRNVQVSAGEVYGAQTVSVPLVAGDDHIGSLRVTTPCPLSSAASQLLNCAAQAISLLVLRHHAAAEAELRLTTGFLDDLLDGVAGTDDGAFSSRASLLGIDVTGLGAVVCVGPVVHDRVDADAPSERTARHIVELVSRAANRAFGHAIVCQRPQEVVVLAHPPSACPESITSSVTAFVDELSLDPIGRTLATGVGRPCHHVGDYSASYTEAALCLRLAEERGESGHIITPSDLGLYALFGQSETRQTLAAVVERALGPLIAADTRGNSEYIKTLSMFLRHDRHLENTSRALHIHVNTLRYRLSKVQSISGVDLRNADERFVLELALRAHQAIGG